MNNKKLMEKVIDMYFQTLHSREQSRRVMVQSSILRKTFGIKEGEIIKNATIPNYERSRVLTDKEVEEEFNKYVGFWEWANMSNDPDKAVAFKNEIYYFIEAVQFFDTKLAEHLKNSFESMLQVA